MRAMRAPRFHVKNSGIFDAKDCTKIITKLAHKWPSNLSPIFGVFLPKNRFQDFMEPYNDTSHRGVAVSVAVCLWKTHKDCSCVDNAASSSCFTRCARTGGQTVRRSGCQVECRL